MVIKTTLYLSLTFVAGWAFAEPCQITSPLPVPVTIAGCTYASTATATAFFPLGINTSTETVTSLTPSRCVETDSSDNLISFTGACGGGGGGGGGGLTYSSFTATDPIIFNNSNGNISASQISLSTGVTNSLPINFVSGLQTQLNTLATLSSFTAISPIIYNGSGQFSASQISLSTGVFGVLPSANLPVDVDYIDVNQTISGVKTFSSSTTLNAGMAIQGGLSFSSLPIHTGNYQALNTDTVILASATLVSVTTITLPSASANPGLVISVWVVDQDTGTVAILGNGSDLIIGTGTWNFHSQHQGGTLESNGIGWETLGQWNANPAYSGILPNININSLEPLGTSSNTISIPFFNSSPAEFCGYRLQIGASGAGFMNIGIADGFTGQVLFSTGPVADTTTGKQTVGTSPFYLNGQYPYLLLFQANNTTVTLITTGGANAPMIGCYTTGNPGTSLVLPSKVNFNSAVTFCPYITLLPCGGAWTQ